MATAGLPLWSTTAANNGSADPAVNWAEGMAPSAVNDSARAEMASVAKWRDDLYGITAGLSTGGTSTAFTVTTNATYATAAIMSGAIFSIIPHTTSGAAPTLAVDGLTARALNVSTGVAIPTGALISGTPYFVRYKHASTEFIVIGPSIGPLSGMDIIGATQNTAIAIDDTLPTYDLSATANRRMLVSDFLKVINLLTADASPDGASDYVMTYDASATAAKKVLLSNLPGTLPRGYIDGMILSNGTDATNDINISAGKCRDSTDTVDIVIATALGKQLDANWTAGGTTGTPAGGRDTAAGIANATYHLYAARTAASSAGDVYMTTATTAAAAITAINLESGGSAYAYARRIGSIVRLSSAIIAFIQNGNYFRWVDPPAVVSNATPGTSANTATLVVPTGLSLRVMLDVISPAGGIVYFSGLDNTDAAPSASGTPIGSIGDGSNTSINQVVVWVNTSAQFRYRSDTNTTLRFTPVEWLDFRGRDA